MQAHLINKTNKKPIKLSVRSAMSLVDLTESLTKGKNLYFSGTGTWVVRDVEIKTLSHLGNYEYYINGTGRYYDHPDKPTEEFSLEFEGLVAFLSEKESSLVLYR